MTEPAAPPEVEPLEDPFSSVLCVVAHPDDIEYGTAAAVHRWTGEGTTVTYYLLTRGEAGIDTMAPDEAARVREEEERESARRVGVDASTSVTTATAPSSTASPLRRDIARAIRRHRPELVVAQTWGLRFGGGMVNQADHRAVGPGHPGCRRRRRQPLAAHRAHRRGPGAVGRGHGDRRGRQPDAHALRRRLGRALRGLGALARGARGLQRRAARGVPGAARAARHDPRRWGPGRRCRARRCCSTSSSAADPGARELSARGPGRSRPRRRPTSAASRPRGSRSRRR